MTKGGALSRPQTFPLCVYKTLTPANRLHIHSFFLNALVSQKLGYAGCGLKLQCAAFFVEPGRSDAGGNGESL